MTLRQFLFISAEAAKRKQWTSKRMKTDETESGKIIECTYASEHVEYKHHSSSLKRTRGKEEEEEEKEEEEEERKEQKLNCFARARLEARRAHQWRPLGHTFHPSFNSNYIGGIAWTVNN